jgi:cytochrome b561
MPEATRYHPLSVGLHWLMAALIAGLVVVGFVMDDLPDGPGKFAAFNTHKLLGVVVLVLVAVRLAWRAGHPPPMAFDAPKWQQALARVAHASLYVLMFALPVSGLLFTNFGRGIRIFALQIAPIGGKNEVLSHFFEGVHEAAAVALVSLVAAHALAALWHHFARRDTTLERMLPHRAGG